MSNIKIDEIIRSHRKTISLQISSDARLIVRAPLFTPKDFIQKLIDRKESWIKAKQELFLKRQQKVLVRKFIQNE